MYLDQSSVEWRSGSKSLLASLLVFDEVYSNARAVAALESELVLVSVSRSGLERSLELALVFYCALMVVSSLHY